MFLFVMSENGAGKCNDLKGWRGFILILTVFFASAEQQVQPHLRGRPVGVVPLESEHTCCIAASATAKSPMRRLIDLEDVGHLAAFLASDLSKSITGGVHYVDCGYEVVG